MAKYRIKEVTRTRGDGSSKILYYPQYLFKLFWIFPIYFNLVDSDIHEERDAKRLIEMDLAKSTKLKEVKIIPYKNN